FVMGGRKGASVVRLERKADGHSLLQLRDGRGNPIVEAGYDANSKFSYLKLPSRQKDAQNKLIVPCMLTVDHHNGLSGAPCGTIALNSHEGGVILITNNKRWGITRPSIVIRDPGQAAARTLDGRKRK